MLLLASFVRLEQLDFFSSLYFFFDLLKMQVAFEENNLRVIYARIREGFFFALLIHSLGIKSQNKQLDVYLKFLEKL